MKHIRKHWKRIAFALLVALVVGTNALAFVHARAMTTFLDGGERTPRPQDLTRWQRLGLLFTGIRVPKPKNKSTPDAFGLAYETRTIASADGTQLEAWRIPRADARGTVLIAHGYASTKSAMLPVAREMHLLGYESVLLDLRAHGGSEGHVTTLGWREAEDVAAGVAQLTSGSPIIFGVSMGAVAAMRAEHAGLIHPRALVLECPFDRMLHAVETRFVLMGVPPFPGARMLVFWGGVQQGFSGFEHDPVVYAKQVRSPVLFLHGEADPTIPMERAQGIFDALASERKTLTTFPGLKHESYLGKQRERWLAAVSAFLSSL